MDDDPAISVLLSVRNGERFLDAALSSLFNQSFQDFEVIVVDNCSTDRTSAIIERWARRDARARPARFARPGLGRSLNYAASIARAPLLARMDGDDQALPDRLEKQQARMTMEPSLGLLGSHAELIDRRGSKIGIARPPGDEEELRRWLRSHCVFVHSSVMMRRSVFEEVGGYREGLLNAEDFDLWSRMAEVTNIANVPEVLVRYRRHSGSLSARQPARMAIAAACVTAAVRARRNGLAEPFIRGSPHLRLALRLLGKPREQFARDVARLKHRHLFETLYVGIPLPGRVKYAIRQIAVSMGLKALLSRALAQGSKPNRKLPAPIQARVNER